MRDDVMKNESLYRDRYRILRRLGEGGSSLVYMGLDMESGKAVTVKVLKERLKPLVEYIQHDIFKDDLIFSQELIVNKDAGILALCDLSTSNTILEIKTNNADPYAYRYQLYYESNGRNCFYMTLEWQHKKGTNELAGMVFRISRIEFEIGEDTYFDEFTASKKEEVVIMKQLSSDNIAFKPSKKRKEKVVPRKNEIDSTMHWDPIKSRGERFKEEIEEKSGGKIEVLEYRGSRENTDVRCTVCDYKWSIRSDHLRTRCYCPCCHRRNIL